MGINFESDLDFFWDFKKKKKKQMERESSLHEQMQIYTRTFINTKPH